MGDFTIHDFLLDTVKGLIGHRPDFSIREMTAGWYSKGVFAVQDVAEIDNLIMDQYNDTELPPVEQEPENSGSV